jgi:hypothetical protein
MIEKDAIDIVTGVVAAIVGPLENNNALHAVPVACDFADMRGLMLEGGEAVYGCGETKGKGRVPKAAFSRRVSNICVGALVAGVFCVSAPLCAGTQTIDSQLSGKSVSEDGREASQAVLIAQVHSRNQKPQRSSIPANLFSLLTVMNNRIIGTHVKLRPERGKVRSSFALTNALLSIALRDAQQKAFKPDRTFDILGLTLDMTAPQAEKQLRGTKKYDRVLIITPKAGDIPRAFAYARVFVRNDSREYIALVTQPDRTGDKLVAIGRYAFEVLGLYNYSNFLSSLQDKYGSPREVNGDLVHWGGLPGAGRTDGPCFVQVGRLETYQNWSTEDGKPIQWSNYIPAGVPSTFLGPQSMTWIALKVADLSRAREYLPCGPTVVAWLPKVGKQVTEYGIWLTDAGAYFDIMVNRIKEGSPGRPKL